MLKARSLSVKMEQLNDYQKIQQNPERRNNPQLCSSSVGSVSEANHVGDHRPDRLTRINDILLTSRQQDGKLETNKKVTYQ